MTFFSHQGQFGTFKKLFGITVAITVSQFCINLLPLRYMNRVSWAAFYTMAFGSLILIIGLPAIAPTRQSWKWVWTQWYDSCDPLTAAPGTCTNPNPIGATAYTGLGSKGWMFCAGLLMSQFLVNCYDIPSHMAEETHHASWTVPRSIIGSYLCAGFLNLCLLLAYLFSMQVPANLGYGVTQGLYGMASLIWDVFAARWPDTHWQAGPGLPVPIFNNETMYTTDNGCLLVSGAACLNVVTGLPNPTASARNGAMFFSFIIFCGAYICGLMNTCAGTRFLYAWARDNGLPFSGLIRKVASFNGVPLYSMALFSTLSIVFLTANLSTNPVEGYVSVSAISSNGYLMAYGVPSLLRLTTARNTFVPSPDFDLGALSKPLAALGVAVSAFSVATIALPEYLPANKDNMNYSGVALGAAIVGGLLFWPFATAVWGFVGPSSGLFLEASAKAGVENAKAAAMEGGIMAGPDDRIAPGDSARAGGVHPVLA